MEVKERCYVGFRFGFCSVLGAQLKSCILRKLRQTDVGLADSLSCDVVLQLLEILKKIDESKDTEELDIDF